MKILIWGTGERANCELNKLDKDILQHIEIVGYVNGLLQDDEKQLFRGKCVFNKKEISKLQYDYICILSYSKGIIIREIIKDKLCEIKKIKDLHEICREVNNSDVNVSIINGLNPKLRNVWCAWDNYEYLKNKYLYVCVNTIMDYDKNKLNKTYSCKKENVWVFWLQGIENAPNIVKICINSIMRNMREAKINILDKNNVNDYVDLPEYIWSKWEKGIISNTMLSDLIRLNLLNRYGGLWLDATIFFTGTKIPEYINNNELFMYHIYDSWYNRPEPCMAANWLIYAKPGNVLLTMTERYLLEYWKHEDYLIDYYIFHYFFAMAVEVFAEEWQKVPYFSRGPAIMLSRELNKCISEERYERILGMSDFHKMSYKITIDEQNKENVYCKMYEEYMNDVNVTIGV